jgi:hypothetical protein
MHKNITLYKIKHYKNMQDKIELASTVTRGKETRRSELRSTSYRVYAKRIWSRTFNSVLSNINYNYYLIKTRGSKRDKITTSKTTQQRATDARTRVTYHVDGARNSARDQREWRANQHATTSTSREQRVRHVRKLNRWQVYTKQLLNI